jgi:AcrR family transcriptional regulator
LNAASRLFHEQGFGATGVATILREANVNSGSLYHFFPTKEALVVEVLKRYLANVHPIVIGPVEQQEPDPIRRVFALLGWYRGLMEMTGCRLGCPIGNLALELADNHPEIRKLADANFMAWTAGVHRWLEQAGDRLPAKIDRRELAQMVLNTMEGGIMQARARGELAPYDAAVRQLRMYFDYLERDALASRTTTKREHNSNPEGDRSCPGSGSQA